MNQFHFLRPEWFLALIPLVLLLWRLRSQRQKSGNWRAVCDPALLPYLLEGEPDKKRNRTWGLVLLSSLLAIISLAGPVWQQLEQPVFREQSALVIALDLSRSMDAADIKPSRLTRAHHKLLDILRQRKEGETALIVYAAQPFVVTPLTDDSATIASQVTSLTTDIMPNQGGRPEKAIAKGLELLEQAGKPSGDLLLITDGIAPNSAEALANLLPSGVRLSVLSVGTEAGAPIPQQRGGFLKDSLGQIVIPSLPRAELRQLTQLAGGQYAELRADDSDINRILSPLHSKQVKNTQEDSNLATERWQEEGPWLLLILLPLGALAFRRGYMVLAFLFLLPFPNDSYALDWNHLWSRPDQKGTELLEQGESAAAAKMFQNSEWKAAAEYKAGQYQQSEMELKNFDTANAHYNRGNALARQGRYAEAIQAYQQTLDKNPEDDDASHNKTLLEDLLKQQDKQEKEKEKEKDQNQQSDQNQQNQQPDDGQDDSKSENQSKGEQSENESSEPSEASQGSPDESEEVAESDQQKADPSQEKDEPQGEMPPSSEPDEGESEEATELESQTNAKETEQSEADKMAEQWLKRIPDDPSGLLKRKFRYQYQQLQERKQDPQPW